ncbi:hypothetical protein TNCV_3328231 [Trichonephila clavipes]|nr:hypothetical protein TNCV_3328231 [Trichonephila clavipes]
MLFGTINPAPPARYSTLKVFEKRGPEERGLLCQECQMFYEAQLWRSGRILYPLNTLNLMIFLDQPSPMWIRSITVHKNEFMQNSLEKPQVRSSQKMFCSVRLSPLQN